MNNSRDVIVVVAVVVAVAVVVVVAVAVVVVVEYIARGGHCPQAYLP